MVWKSVSPKRTGRKILKYTAEAGMTPQEVAAALGLSGSAIVYKWIEGSVRAEGSASACCCFCLGRMTFRL